jgi:hypothetical protein
MARLYTRRLPAIPGMSDTPFTPSKVTIHNSDNHMSLKVLIESKACQDPSIDATQ